jgi:hypothetical protein
LKLLAHFPDYSGPQSFKSVSRAFSGSHLGNPYLFGISYNPWKNTPDSPTGYFAPISGDVKNVVELFFHSLSVMCEITSM